VKTKVKPTEWAIPNRLALGRPHPVRCAMDGCATVVSIYNASTDGLCWRHDTTPSAKEQRALARRLERH
jgi:hypothetical protein